MLELNSGVGRMQVMNAVFISAGWRDENPRKKSPALLVALVRMLLT